MRPFILLFLSSLVPLSHARAEEPRLRCALVAYADACGESDARTSFSLGRTPTEAPAANLVLEGADASALKEVVYVRFPGASAPDALSVDVAVAADGGISGGLYLGSKERRGVEFYGEPSAGARLCGARGEHGGRQLSFDVVCAVE